MRGGRTGQDDRQTINPEVQHVFHQKTRSEIISAEVQEGLAHLGTAVTEAGRAAAEQLAPHVEAAQRAVAPRMAAAAAVAAPAVASARDALSDRVEAARDVAASRMDAAREAAVPRVTAAQLAAARAATDLGPRVDAARGAAQKALRDDVAPRLTAAQAAALGYATPRVVAAREAVSPALDSARGTLVAGVESARSELDARRAELAAAAAESSRKTRKAAKKARKKAGKKQREFEKAALATATAVKRRGGAKPEPTRWPWVFAVLAVGTAVFVLLRRKKADAWTPAPAGDGPVPSYREDPVPSSDNNSGKTVSTATGTPSDSAPAESDMGVRDAQLVDGDGPDDASVNGTDAPEPFTSGGGADAGPTAGPTDKQV